MTPQVQIVQGDCLTELAKLPTESVHCCVTSPPYWGLRDYGVAGQIGLEKTPEEYVAKMVAVFREVKRVLREDGTLWLNLGDSYNAAGRDGHGTRIGFKQGTNRASANGDDANRPSDGNLKPKDLVGIPWRVAFALQADGWYLRSAAPWVKRNSMPESCQDRPATAVEQIFLLTKSARYYYDAEAVKLPGSMALLKQVEEGYNGKATKDFSAAGAQDASAVKSRIIAGKRDKQRGHSRRHDGFNDRWDQMEKEEQYSGWRSCRNSDWFFESIGGMLLDEDFAPLAFVVNPQGYAESHFATFPPPLIKPMILAGTSAKGCCPKCGAGWERVVEVNRKVRECGGTSPKHASIMDSASKSCFKTNLFPETKTLGWQPTCECGESQTVPATVLDPFGGSGTTGEVALELGRSAILIELKPDYVQLARRRTLVTPGLLLA